MSAKPSNPKDAVGVKKMSMACVPAPVLAEVAIGMHEGALKYGRHNYRSIKVRSSVYYDATMRHLFDWWEGEDIDPLSDLSHVTKAITSLVVLRDAMIMDMLDDDRPPRAPKDWLEKLNKRVERLMEKFPEPKQPYTHIAR